MSDLPPDLGSGHEPDAVPSGGPGGSGRAASVTLRGADESASLSVMDPANQSLADALAITFKLVLVGMVVIVALYLFSGVQTIREGQRGLRLLFGKPVARDLEPGVQFSFPRPLGDLVRVDMGTLQIDEKEFWPDGDGTNVDSLRELTQLNPERDGSLITADDNVAHAYLQVVYRRANAADWAENVYRADEERMVRAAVQRGMVLAASTTSIDDLLKSSDRVAQSAQASAQQMLDELGTGIRIDRLQVVEKIPPKKILPSFAKVGDADQRSGQSRDEATSEANRVLNDVAGPAHTALSAMIDRYEFLVESGDDAAAAALLAQIDLALQGEPVTLGDSSLAVSGEVSRILAEAQQEATETAQHHKSRLDLFAAKRLQLTANPGLMVQSDWANAYRTFLGGETVERMYLPEGTEGMLLVINRDPEIAREVQEKLKSDRVEAAREAREEGRRRSRYQTQTGVVPDEQ